MAQRPFEVLPSSGGSSGEANPHMFELVYHQLFMAELGLVYQSGSPISSEVYKAQVCSMHDLLKFVDW